MTFFFSRILGRSRLGVHHERRRAVLRVEQLETRWALDVGLGFALRIGDAFTQVGNAVAADQAGNSYVTGQMTFTALDFDPGAGSTLIPPGVPAVNGSTAFLAKYAPDGSLVWARTLANSSANSTAGYDVTVDSQGNVYATGIFGGLNIDFDPGPGVFAMTEAGSGYNGFVSKFDANGNFSWARQIIAGDSTGILPALDVDSLGNAYVTGKFGTSYRLRALGSDVIGPITGAGGGDIFLAKLDTHGTWQWGRAMGSPSLDYAPAVAVDSAGNSHIVGFFSGLADFDPGPGVSNLSTTGANDIFAAKYDSAGQLVWARRAGGTSSDEASAVAIDPSGNVLITGHFRQTADFDPSAATFNLISSSGSSPDAFVWKLTSAGDFAWAKRLGSSTTTDAGAGIATDIQGSVYSTGYFGGTADFDPGAAVFNLSSTGSDDVYLSKFNANGDFQWAKSMGGSSSDQPRAIAVTPGASTRRVYTTGLLSSTNADFDPSAGTLTLASAGGVDFFLSQLFNPGPIADIGGPYSTTTDASLTLTAAASFDANSDIVEYAWELDNDGQFDDAFGVTATFSSTLTGARPIQVRVTDSDGAASVAAGIVTMTHSGETREEIRGTAGPDLFTVIFAESGVTVTRSTAAGVVLQEISYPVGTIVDIQGEAAFDQVTVALTPGLFEAWTNPQLANLQAYLASPTEQSLDLVLSPGGGLALSEFETITFAAYEESQILNVTRCIASLPGVENIRVGDPAGNDTLQGTAAADLLFGRGGNDWLEGLQGVDCLIGGAGADSLLGSDNDDILYGGSGPDSLVGADGFDQLYGGAGDDSLDGGLHDDQLDGGPGVDASFGGAGYDAFLVRGDEAKYDVLRGGENVDTIFNDQPAPVVLATFDGPTVLIEGWVGNGQPIIGDDADNEFTFLISPSYSMSLSGVPYIDGGKGNDTIIGTHGVDQLRGGDGNDRLVGLGGADLIVGDAGDDTLEGGEGTDLLDGGDGLDLIYTGGGRDTVRFVADLGSLDTLGDFALYSDRIDLIAYSLSYAQISFERAGSMVTVQLANGKRIRLLNWNRVVSSSQFVFA